MRLPCLQIVMCKEIDTGLIECTSSVSLWRGYDYYKARKVENLKKINDTQYTADVDGTMSEPY